MTDRLIASRMTDSALEAENARLKTEVERLTEREKTLTNECDISLTANMALKTENFGLRVKNATLKAELEAAHAASEGGKAIHKVSEDMPCVDCGELGVHAEGCGDGEDSYAIEETP